MRAKGTLLLLTVSLILLLASCRKDDYYPSTPDRLQTDWTLDKKVYIEYGRDGYQLSRYEELYDQDSYYRFSRNGRDYDAYEHRGNSRVSINGYYRLIDDYTLQMDYKGYQYEGFQIRDLSTRSLTISTKFVDASTGRVNEEILYMYR